MSVSKTPGKKPLAHFHSFIASIPDDKVVGGNSSGTLHSTKDYRFDLQGQTSHKNPPRSNLQVQINKQCEHPTIAQYAPGTAAIAFLPNDEKLMKKFPPSVVRSNLLESTYWGKKEEKAALAKAEELYQKTLDK